MTTEINLADLAEKMFVKIMKKISVITIGKKQEDKKLENPSISEGIKCFQNQLVFSVLVMNDNGQREHEALFFKEEDAKEYSKQNQRAWNSDANKIRQIHLDYVQNSEGCCYPISYSDKIV